MKLTKEQRELEDYYDAVGQTYKLGIEILKSMAASKELMFDSLNKQIIGEWAYQIAEGFVNIYQERLNETPGDIRKNRKVTERQTLGAILLQNKILDRVLGIGVTSQNFKTKAYQKIFEIMLEISKAGQQINLVTLTERLRKLNIFELIGGAKTLTELFDDLNDVFNIDSARTLLE